LGFDPFFSEFYENYEMLSTEKGSRVESGDSRASRGGNSDLDGKEKEGNQIVERKKRNSLILPIEIGEVKDDGDQDVFQMMGNMIDKMGPSSASSTKNLFVKSVDVKLKMFY
jgi:hypothetical protein